MKKKFKKAIAVILTMAMTMSVGVPVFAAEEEPSIEVTPEMISALEETGEYEAGNYKIVLSSNEEYWSALAESKGITYDEAIELDKRNIENFFANQPQGRGIIAHDSAKFNAVNAATLICEGKLKNADGISMNMGVEYGCRLRLFISGTGGKFIDGSITNEYAVASDTGFYDFVVSYADAYFSDDLYTVYMSTRGTFVITESYATSVGITLADILDIGGSYSADLKYRVTKTFSDSAYLRH